MTEKQITIYTPESSLANPAKMLREMFRDLAACRELAWRLAVRDVKSQYRQAFLGILWAFVLPLSNTVTWIVLSKSGIVSVSNTSLPYPVYVFTGTMLWAIFMDALNAPMQQVNTARGMLAKLNFPREALIVSGIYQTLFNAAIKVALLLGVLVVMGILPGWNLLLFPLGIISLMLVGTALGLLITPVGKAVRLGSMVVGLRLDPTTRPYVSWHENCPFLENGRCGACIQRCPAGAISGRGHDKKSALHTAGLF